MRIIFDEASGHGRNSQPAGQPIKKRPYTIILQILMIFYGRRQRIEVLDAVLLIQLLREIIITWAGRSNDIWPLVFLGAP